MAELVASGRQRSFGLAKRDTLPRFCRECDVRFACHGGCPKDRFTSDPYGEPGLNYLCPSFKFFFQHVSRPMGIMAELLRQGRAPAEIMQRYAAEDAKRGRNDPCTCGGGEKWKRCHGAGPASSRKDRTSCGRSRPALRRRPGGAAKTQRAGRTQREQLDPGGRHA
jgi:uncharacterized protein